MNEIDEKISNFFFTKMKINKAEFCFDFSKFSQFGFDLNRFYYSQLIWTKSVMKR